MERITGRSDVLHYTITDDFSVLLVANELVDLYWRPAPVELPPAFSAQVASERAAAPGKFGIGEQPWKLVHSSWVTTHELLISETADGPKILFDKNSDELLGGDAPDGGSISQLPSLAAGKQDLAPLAALPPSESLVAAGSSVFDWSAAYQYALTWSSNSDPNLANPAYQNFLSSGTDCANFVSQAFEAGKYTRDGLWYPYSGAWALNWSLRNWLISSGRGFAQPSASLLGYADIVNYDWSGNGSFDHVVIVTGLPGPLISSHTKNYRNVHWTYPASNSPDAKFAFASTALFF